MNEIGLKEPPSLGEQPSRLPNAKVQARTMLIDTDVHETLPSTRDLVPYIDPIWRRFLTDQGGRWSGLGLGSTYAMATAKNGARADWNLDDGTAATDPAISGRHLFDDLGISIAILNGFFHVSRLDQDYEFAQALARAYNDWQIDKWLSSDPRYRGSVHVVAHDPAVAAAEIDRVGKHPQIVQVFLPTVENRQYGDPMYRPIYEAALRNDLAIAMHHGGRTPTVIGYPRYFIEWHCYAAPHVNMAQLASFIFNGTFDVYPDLKLVILETGVAWLPWLMGRMDQQYRELRSTVPWVKRLPSDHVRSNVRISTQPLNDITPRNFAEMVKTYDLQDVYVFSSDYPHWDSDSPDVVLGALPEDLREGIRHRNALQAFPRLRDLAK